MSGPNSSHLAADGEILIAVYDVRPRDVRNRRGSRVAHRQLEFPREDVENDFDAL